MSDILRALTKQGELIEENLDSFYNFNQIEIGAVFKPAKKLVDRFQNEGINLKVINPLGYFYCIIHNSFKFYEDSQNSVFGSALNLAERIDQEKTLRLMFLPEESFTPKHFYRSSNIVYYPLGGECFIDVPEGLVYLDKREYKVPFRNTHKLMTENRHHITLLKIIRNSSIKDSDDFCIE